MCICKLQFFFARDWFLIRGVSFVCQATDEAKKQRDTEELGDAMKALENRTLDSKQEMDILAALDEMKSMRVSSFPFKLRHIHCREFWFESSSQISFNIVTP